MNNNNHKNCGFGTDAAVYLYGELEKGKQVNFETHLAKCDSCAEEFADFAALRSGIADWKMKNFDVLATPVIEIPYEKSAPFVEIRTEKISWFDSLKNALTFSPAMATIATVMVLALFGSIIYLTFNSNGEELVSNINIKDELVTSPAIENQKPELKVEENRKPNNSTAPEVVENKTNNENKSTPAIIKTKVPEKPQSVTVARETPKKIKTSELKRKSNNVKTIEQNSQVQAQTKLPKLNMLPDEEEVNELSLSDLLADVDAK